ncbi:hypothetical protein [Burkholderia ambifaria]|uniref:hypothetical protein n=1 Tax=Burkholderia ambifaria TaxID=152480 RepID=UPI001B93ACF5|nr:hypothetical protein [Burkholderia ambifaria]MBR8174864.1 hypothetical protein [Burkholderia ambifaria]
MKNTRVLGAVICVLFAVCGFSGCSMHLVPDYDADMDKGISDVQGQVEAIFGKLIDCVDLATQVCADPTATYSANDYSKIRNKLNVLIVRSESVAHNEDTTRQLYLLAHSLYENAPMPTANLQADTKSYPKVTLQKRQSTKVAFALRDITADHDSIKTQFRSALTYELAKKSGTVATPSK